MKIDVTHRLDSVDLNDTRYDRVGEYTYIGSELCHVVYYIDAQGNYDALEVNYYKGNDHKGRIYKLDFHESHVIPDYLSDIFIKLRYAYWNRYSNLVDVSQVLQ